MGVDCHGWVEVCDARWHARETLAPFQQCEAVGKIDDIVERNYCIYGFFFGVHDPIHDPIHDPTHRYTAVADRRGLPPHVSEVVRQAAGDNDDVARSAATWVLWSEIQASNWQATIELSAGWKRLFTLMEDFADHYGERWVGLVIWFDQSAFL